MSPFHRPIAIATPITRALSAAALLGATMLVTPLTAAHAASAATPPLQLAQATTPQTPPTPATPPTSKAVPEVQAAPQTQSTTPTQPMPQAQTGDSNAAAKGDTTAATKPETVDQRITSLHAALQITPQQEPKWDRVATVMRANASAMQKLVDERDAQGDSITAVQDLKEYEKFAQAHAVGLHKLITAFDALYTAMPPAQQKVADQVFENFGHHPPAAAHS